MGAGGSLSIQNVVGTGLLNERQRRLVAAAEARDYGHGGVNSGGSNGYRIHLWKYELQNLCNELQISICVSHFPPGTSKWNKIEHRLFSFISKNWRGKSLLNYRNIIDLIAGTTTKTGLIRFLKSS